MCWKESVSVSVSLFYALYTACNWPLMSVYQSCLVELVEKQFTLVSPLYLCVCVPCMCADTSLRYCSLCSVETGFVRFIHKRSRP